MARLWSPGVDGQRGWWPLSVRERYRSHIRTGDATQPLRPSTDLSRPVTQNSWRRSVHLKGVFSLT